MCGPPAGGKTSYIEANASPGDTVVSLDLVSRTLNGKPVWDIRSDAIPRVVLARNELIRVAAQVKGRGRVWIEETGAERWKRQHWRGIFAVDSIVVVEAAPEVCRARIAATPARAARPGAADGPDAWWEAYTVDYSDTRIAA